MIKLRIKKTDGLPVIVAAGYEGMDFGGSLAADEEYVLVDVDAIPDDIHFAWTVDGEKLVRRPEPLSVEEYQQFKGIVEPRLDKTIATLQALVDNIRQRLDRVEQRLQRP